MIRVKICGITTVEDAETAVREGANALGFVCVPSSPRYVSPETAAEIIRTLPPLVAAVGVFVNTPNEAIEAATRIAGFHMVQLHGNESPQQARDSRAPVIKAFRYFDALPADIWAYPPAHTLLDKGLPGKWGGTGERIDWRILSEQLDPYPDLRARLILAGGLTPENVEEAVRIVRPAAVDVSGGVENEPGRKSPAKIKEFMHVVRSLSCERLHA